ncbi:MAG: tRNA pseudouridine(55) synthase TruB [Rhodocyclaceae bacterium]|jgi:tRNA pseudouridine55 synthase|nr:tRNA pseudouridine(55) synthase TruB [Rhodocyclaceae bacterium]
MQPRRRARRQVDGVLVLDKPPGMTSNAALQTARRLLNAAKAGHTGTLDPMATGLLPLTFGEATKFSQMLLDADKTYEACIQLGVSTDTGDAEGTVLERRPVAFDVGDVAQLEQVLACFRGEIEQVPPMYSALKRDGKPLYEYAREGVEVERTARRVTIHALDLLAVDREQARLTVRVSSSKGTYIRSLAMDIGEKLGCGAHLCALRRTAIGPLRLDEAVTLAQLEAVDEPARDALLAPPDRLVEVFPAVRLDESQARTILHGQGLSDVPDGPQGLVRLYHGQRFLGLGERQGDGHVLPKRLIATSDQAVAVRND